MAMKIISFLLTSLSLPLFVDCFSVETRAYLARPITSRSTNFRHGAAVVSIPDPEPKLTLPDPPVRAFKWQPIRWIVKTLLVQVLGYAFFTAMVLVNGVASAFYIIIKFWMRKIKLVRYGGFMTAHTFTPLVELKFGKSHSLMISSRHETD